MKQLILIRHGKPEPGRDGEPDALRELTPAGRAALAAPTGFAHTFAQLTADAAEAGFTLSPAGAPLELWTSPAVRAQQTALEAAAALERIHQPVTAPQTCEALWEQDAQAIMAALDQSDAATVIAVGHIPFMNHLTGWLTGESVSFSPGAAALILVPDLVGEGTSALISFVPGPEVEDR